MTIDYQYFLCFFLLFMSIQIILCISELNPYLNMISDIQGYKTNMFKNNNNQFTFRWIFIFTIFSFVSLLFIYYYIIYPRNSLLQGFIFVSILFAFWDINYLVSFDKGVKHFPVILYDIFVVGGLSMVISQYILYNYYYIIKNYIFLLFILYALIQLFGCYIGYTYNPDLSNIKGFVLF